MKSSIRNTRELPLEKFADEDYGSGQDTRNTGLRKTVAYASKSISASRLSEQMSFALDMGTEAVVFPETWSATRVSVARAVSSRSFDLAMAAVIMANLFTTVREADINARCAESREGSCIDDLRVIMLANNVILFIYCVECAVKIFVFRRTWWQNSWNVFDAVVAVSGILGEVFADVIPRASMLRVLRVARLTKLVRFFMSLRELYLILSGFTSVAKTIFWTSILLFFALTVCSVVAVEYLHPVNIELDHGACTWCADAFKTVMKSNVTLFQIVIIGDSWSLFAQPLIDKEPLTGLLLIVVALIFMMGFANLIMSVIVEKAIESRAEDERFQLIIQEEKADKAKAHLVEMCKDLDDDESGALTYDELINNYDTNRQFLTTLKSMKIDKDDLDMVFHMLDDDNSGAVSFKEFADNLYKMKTAGTTTMLMSIRYNMHIMEKQVKRMQCEMRTRLASCEDMLSLTSQALHDMSEERRRAGVTLEHSALPSQQTVGSLDVSTTACNSTKDLPRDHQKERCHERCQPQAQRIGLRQDSEDLEEIFFKLLSAVAQGSVRQLEDQARALAQSVRALTALDDAMPLWAGELKTPVQASFSHSL